MSKKKPWPEDLTEEPDVEGELKDLPEPEPEPAVELTVKHVPPPLPENEAQRAERTRAERHPPQ